MQKSPLLGGKTNQGRHLKQYVRTTDGQRETTWDLTVQAPTSLATPKVVINYIHGGLIDERYNSKQKRQRLLHATSVRERVNSDQHNFPKWSMRPVDDIVTFLIVNSSRVLQPHEDVLVLTLGISGFVVRRILIYSGSSADISWPLTNVSLQADGLLTMLRGLVVCQSRDLLLVKMLAQRKMGLPLVRPRLVSTWMMRRTSRSLLALLVGRRW